MLKSIRENSIIASALLLFFAFLKLKWYYDGFNISIINYLSFSEIMTYLLSDIWTFILTIVAIYFISILGFTIMILLDKYFYLNIENEYKKIKQKPEIWVIVFAIGTCLIFVGLISDTIHFKWWSAYLLILSISQLLNHFFMVLNDNPNSESLENTKKVSEETENIITIIGCFILVIFFNARNELNEKLSQNEVVKIVSTDTTICSKETLNIFVGKTSDFLFVYDCASKTSKTIPMSEVKLIEIMSK